MARFAPPFRGWPVAWGRHFLLCAVGILVVWSGASLAGQDEPKPQDGPIHTLHVYANLLQVPTLVLGPNRERLTKPIAESRFSVSIDAGPWFRATHVRLEGDDPISLSILLDVTGDSSELMPKIADVIAGLAPLSLHAKDHVSIYALDCSLLRSLNDVPAESALLKVGVDSVLESWTIRRRNKHVPSCRQSVNLWDALAHILGELSKLPGRRVILAVTDGHDRGSHNSWNGVRYFAQTTSTAVFGMRDLYGVPGNRSVFPRSGSEDPFQSVCELSGGLVLQTNTRSLEETLERFTTMLRERYIVEFPRPYNSTPGEHALLVKIEKAGADFIGQSGVTVPIPDQAVLADPTTVPSDPSKTPEVGKRRVVTKPQ